MLPKRQVKRIKERRDTGKNWRARKKKTKKEMRSLDAHHIMTTLTRLGTETLAQGPTRIPTPTSDSGSTPASKISAVVGESETNLSYWIKISDAFLAVQLPMESLWASIAPV